MNAHDTDIFWDAWVHGTVYLPHRVLADAARNVKRYLEGADTSTIVPLMTRCRALPDVIAAIRGCDAPGWDSTSLRQAQRDVKAAFVRLQKAAALPSSP